MPFKSILRGSTLTLILILCGCTSFASNTPQWAPEPPQSYIERGRELLEDGFVQIYDVELDNLYLLCGSYETGVALACAWPPYRTRNYWVIFTSSREFWIITHELAHVGGWEH